MSYTFRIRVPGAVMMRQLRALADDPRWRVAGLDDDDDDDEPDDRELVDGAAWLIYLRGASSRGVAVGRRGAELEVRINLCASAADHALAIDLAIRLAAQAETTIACEDEGAPVSPDALRARAADWIADQTAWAPGIVASMVDREGQVVHMSGPRREFAIGPRFLAELRAGSDDLGRAMLAAMVALQDLDDYHRAMAMTVTQQDGTVASSYAVWGPRGPYLFRRVTKLTLTDDVDRVVIPWERGPEVAGGGWRWRDEHHATVERTDAVGWQARLARARQVALPE